LIGYFLVFFHPNLLKMDMVFYLLLFIY